MPETTQQPPSLLRLPQVIARVGLGRSSIYQRLKNGDFPAPIPISGGESNRKLNADGSPRRKPIVAWSSADIDLWVSAQIEAAAKSRAGAA